MGRLKGSYNLTGKLLNDLLESKSIEDLKGIDEALSVTQCRELPESIRKLQSLRVLDLSMCDSLKKLPESIGALKGLEILILPASLKRWPKCIGEMNGLKCVELISGPNLVEMLEPMGALQGLKNLTLECEQMPGSIGLLKGLKQLERLPESIGLLKGLNYLELSWCVDLLELPESIGALQVLETLSLAQCQKLKRLPESIGLLKGLKNLKLFACVNLLELPESIGALEGLEMLTLTQCEELKRLPESIGLLKGLQSLELFWCVNLLELPESIGVLRSLQTLYLTGCINLKRLPESIRALRSLQTLDLTGCIKLEKMQTVDLSTMKDISSTLNATRQELMYILQQQVQNPPEHLIAMLDRLLLATGSGITRVCDFSDSTMELDNHKGGSRILCAIGVSGHDLEFFFQDSASMSKVIGIGVRNSCTILTSNLETLVEVYKYEVKNQWETMLAEAAKEESIYEDLLVQFAHVDLDMQPKRHALSSKEFGVGLEGFDETSMTIFANTIDSVICDTKVTPLLWEVGKYFLLKRANQLVGKTHGLSGSSYSGNFNKGDSRGESSNSRSGHRAKCTNQSTAANSNGRSQKTPDDGDDDGDDSVTGDDKDGDGDKDRNPNPPREADEDDENLNTEMEVTATVTLIFKDGVGEFVNEELALPVPKCLEECARIFPEIRFDFVKKSMRDRKSR